MTTIEDIQAKNAAKRARGYRTKFTNGDTGESILLTKAQEELGVIGAWKEFFPDASTVTVELVEPV